MVDLATAMALARFLHLAATLSLLGTVGFTALILPAAGSVPDPLHRRLVRLWWISGLLALLAGVVWFTLQAAAIAGAETWSDLRDALPLVAGQTRYGHTMLARLLLLLPATVLAIPAGQGAQWPRYPAFLLTAVALFLQGLIGHAGATEGVIGTGLVVSESLHLLAAGLWLGALIPIWLSLRALPAAASVGVCERFTPVGLACVLVLAATGFLQALELIASLPALVGTRYGHFAMLKIALFLAALVLALLNRLWLTDRVTAENRGARRHLLQSVSIETVIGLAIVSAAAFMASSPPAAHTPPVWPFPWRFSLVTVNEDPDFRREVIVSLAAIGAAVVLVAAAFLARRFRLAALALLLLVLAWRGRSLDLLAVRAYPTSFQTAPGDFSVASIARGAALYSPNCAACHGPDGAGNGPAAAGLRIRPTDLTMPDLAEHSDGDMFWWLTHGIDDPEGGLAMPGFASRLSDDDRWALVDYLRAHNAAIRAQADSAFDAPMRAPAAPLSCSGSPASGMADLLGHAVHVVTDASSAVVPPPGADIVTLVLSPQGDTAPSPGTCVAASPSAWQAYAILADLPPANLAGTEFLIDAHGWLRAVHRPAAAGGWRTGQSLIAAIRFFADQPIQSPSEGHHAHHH
jgi:putative copper export protein/mono/diheme cytochrome c family protein